MQPNLIEETIKDNSEFFYVIGALEGDGHLNPNSGLIKINVIDKEFIETIQKIMFKLSPQTRVNLEEINSDNINIKKQYKLTIHSKDYFNKQLHTLLPQTGLEKRYYLSGLFDAEGSVGIYKRKGFKKWLRLYQKDISKLIVWKGYLESLGIKSILTEDKTTRSNIEILDFNSIQSFESLINFMIPRKREQLYKVLLEMEKIQNKKDLTKNIHNMIIDVYKNTNFGIRLIAKAFNQSPKNIHDILKRNHVNIFPKNKINSNDKNYLNKLGKLEFKYDERRIDSERYKNIILIYTQTNFGVKYISKLFKVYPTTIQRFLKRRGLLINKKNYNKITSDDINYVERLLNKKIEFNITQSRKFKGGDEKYVNACDRNTLEE